MNDSDLIKLNRTKARLFAGMVDYMISTGEGAGYTEDDIDKCDAILGGFIASLEHLERNAAEAEILLCVKKVVMDLNYLNERAGGSLIETDQREALCEYIQDAAMASGLKNNGDVTEEWRDW